MGRVERHLFTFRSHAAEALENGALYLPGMGILCVSDLHLGKSDRIARLGGGPLPPYDGHATLAALDAAIEATDPATVVCLGDSFDDDRAGAELDPSLANWLTRLAAGREWIWVAGNHDPAPIELPGANLRELTLGDLILRHEPTRGAVGEIAGHFHPKAWISLSGRRRVRPAFLVDQRRIIMPAFGAYTGGLRCTDPALEALMGTDARAILTGRPVLVVPMPRANRTHAPGQRGSRIHRH